MAERRMFAKTIVDSDAFLEMPQSTQLLYFHFSMRADDEGFINNPKAILRSIGCKDDDMKILTMKKFIIPFESGVVVIKHWKIHNYIQSDRFIPTKYKDEKAQLEMDENKAYRIPKSECIQNVSTLDTQVSIGKVSIGKLSIEEDSTLTLGEFKNVKLSKEEYEKIVSAELTSYIENLSSYLAQTGKRYKSHYATILNWSRKDNKPILKKSSGRVERVTDYNKTEVKELTESELEALHEAFRKL